MDFLSDGDWWTTYALDGIIGGLLGGLVTGLAVFATIRHERKQRDISDVYAAASDVQAKTYELSARIEAGQRGAESNLQLLDLIIAARAATLRLAGRARARWPGFAKTVEGYHLLVGEAMKQEADKKIPQTRLAVATLKAMSSSCADWMSNPDEFEPRAWQRRKKRRLREASIEDWLKDSG